MNSFVNEGVGKWHGGNLYRSKCKHSPVPSHYAKASLDLSRPNHDEVVYGIARLRAYGIHRKAVWNQYKVLYGIKPQGNAPSVMPYRFADSIHASRDYIPSLLLGSQPKKRTERFAFRSQTADKLKL